MSFFIKHYDTFNKAAIFVILLTASFLSTAIALIFYCIKNFTGYCTPFIDQVIERVTKMDTWALKEWANS